MQHVASILQRTIPKEQSAPISQAESPSESLTTYMTWADKFLTNTTEMEVNARILPLVLDTVSQCDNVIINLQPSVDGHPVFTDFCFVTRDERAHCRSSKQKKVQTYQICALRQQALRKCSGKCTFWCARIILLHLPIVLTNSMVWSFGLVERVTGMDKIKVTKLLMKKDEDMPLPLHCLKCVVQGNWFCWSLTHGPLFVWFVPHP